MGFGKHNPLEFPVNICPTCHQGIPLDSRVYGHDGMFDEYPLSEFKLDGETYQEIVQHCIWSSGPMLYQAYKRMRDGVLFSYWLEDELEDY